MKAARAQCCQLFRGPHSSGPTCHEALFMSTDGHQSQEPSLIEGHQQHLLPACAKPAIAAIQARVQQYLQRILPASAKPSTATTPGRSSRQLLQQQRHHTHRLLVSAVAASICPVFPAVQKLDVCWRRQIHHLHVFAEPAPAANTSGNMLGLAGPAQSFQNPRHEVGVGCLTTVSPGLHASCLSTWHISSLTSSKF